MDLVSRETAERLEVFARLVAKWSPAINLVARSDLDQLTTRHIADSLQLVPMIGSGTMADLGSGGGFPGLVIAAAKAGDPLRITLVEADIRKATFLRTAMRKMHLGNVVVLNQRIEAASPQATDYVTARALAPLPSLLGLVHRHLAPRGSAFLMKGSQWRTEVDAARQMWDFTCEAIPSTTEPSAAILHVTDLQPR